LPACACLAYLPAAACLCYHRVSRCYGAWHRAGIGLYFIRGDIFCAANASTCLLTAACLTPPPRSAPRYGRCLSRLPYDI